MRLKALFRWLLRQLLEWLGDVPKPGRITLKVTAENGNMLTFKINLPPLPDPAGDIASGELKVSINGVASEPVTTTLTQTAVEGLQGLEGETVRAEFRFVDDAGNKSQEASVLTVVLSDTIPPPNPGEMSLEVTAES